MSCAEVRSLLALRSLAVLEEDEAAVVGQHVGTCAACQQESGELEAAVALLRTPAPHAKGPREGARAAIWEKVQVELDTHREEPVASEPALVSIALVCCFCHGVLARREACYCASCLAPHHGECFLAHGRCSALGCEETQTVRPKDSETPRPVALPRQRFRRYGLGAVLLVLGGVGGAVAARGPSHGPALAPPAPALAPPVDPPSPVPAPTTPQWTPGVSPGTASVKMLCDVEADDTDLRDVVAAISSQVGTNVFVEPDVHEKVSITLRQIPWRDGVDVIAKMCKCDVTEVGEDTLVLTQVPKVTIQFTSANVHTVLQLLAAYSGKNIVISRACPAAEVSIDLHEVNWLKALRAIVRAYGVHAVTRGDIIVVLPGPGPDLPDDATGSPLKWPFENLKVVDPAGNPMVKRVDVAVEDADLRELCDEIGRMVGHNIIVEPDVHEKVSIALRHAPWHDALLTLAQLTRCHVDERGSVFVLSQPPKITLQATDTPALQWFQLLAAEAGKNVVVAPEVKGEVTLDLHEVKWQDALEATALAMGYEVIDLEGILTVRAPKAPEKGK
jgi:hypothetical protein